MSTDLTQTSGSTETPTRPTYCPWCTEFLKPGSDLCTSCGREVVDLRLGSVVAGRYRIESVLGQGGMGKVYRAQDLETKDLAAVKFLHAEWSMRPEARARFKREALALSTLRHASIVQILDFGEHDGCPYLAMEFLEGTAIEKLIVVDGRTMPVERVVWIIDEVLRLLELAHAADIVHRDLKPANVMLVGDGTGADRVKVLDFGLALVNDRPEGDRLTAKDSVRGTPLYMAPEQCRGRDITPAADIYTVGVMMYELLAGDVPFGGASATEVMSQHMFSPPPPMAQRGVRPKLPVGLEALVLRTLSKHPEERPTATEFRAELARAMRGDDATSRADRAASDRVAQAGRERSDRGPLTSPRTSPTAPTGAAAGGDPRLDGLMVLVWRLDEARADELRDTLAVATGLSARVHVGNAPPEPSLATSTMRAVVVAGGARAGADLRALRADAAWSRVPVLVMDTEKAEDNATLIRAGASDVVMRNVPMESVAQKVTRLVRRRR